MIITAKVSCEETGAWDSERLGSEMAGVVQGKSVLGNMRKRPQLHVELTITTVKRETSAMWEGWFW